MAPPSPTIALLLRRSPTHHTGGQSPHHEGFKTGRTFMTLLTSKTPLSRAQKICAVLRDPDPVPTSGKDPASGM